ncbi:MAG: T9SS type A sorting domain-containing protein [Saprospirales bacterium]|nr:T9SS type A sorting domain-containing protein [Saprospirales bacterium]
MNSKYLYLPLFLLLLLQAPAAFSQHAIDFDGIDDQIVVPGASSLIANGNMSLSFWVYPTNPAPNFPNFDGFAGFRNNSNADFYILHYSTTKVEARFRNSSGVVFDILYNGMYLNTWNHFTLTYDGTKLSLFHNGEAAGVIAANGVIASTTEPLNMGYLPYFSTPYFFDGQLDDVCLWSKCLTTPEVVELFNNNCSQDLGADGLELCYQFDQGTPGGNNTAITMATESIVGMDAPLSNFTLTGGSSNFVGFLHTGYTFLDEFSCGDPVTSPTGNYTWTETGFYSDTIFNGDCIDVYFVSLAVNPIDATVTQTSSYSLSANMAGAVYQWIDCSTGDAIPGATDRTFEAPVPGTYAVVVTVNACSDTSACYNLEVNGVNSLVEAGLEVYPNPANDQVFIRLDDSYSSFTVELIDANGRLVAGQNNAGDREVMLDVSALPGGVYFLRLVAEDKARVVKLIVD